MKPRFVVPFACRDPRIVRWELKHRSRSSYNIINNEIQVCDGACPYAHVWVSKIEDHTWFTRIPYPKNGVRTTSGNEGSPFTSNINAIESFPTELCMEKKVSKTQLETKNMLSETKHSHKMQWSDIREFSLTMSERSFPISTSHVLTEWSHDAE